MLFFFQLGLQGFYTELQLAGVLLMLQTGTGGKQDVKNLPQTISTDGTVFIQMKKLLHFYLLKNNVQRVTEQVKQKLRCLMFKIFSFFPQKDTAD